MDNPKFEIQDNQYKFPYHYLAFIDNEIPQIKRTIDWGFEYLSYMNVVIDEIEQLEYENILDIGCGDGYLLNNLKNNKQKLGIDLSEKAIMFANSFSSDTEFIVEDLFNISKEYDVVSLIEVLEHIPNDFVESFMTKVLSLVIKNGYFIISVPTTVIPVSKKHYRHYNEELLTKHIESFSNVKLIKEKRIYKSTIFLKIMIKLINNKLWTINSKNILKNFWKWHIKNNINATKENGQHIIRIYKKV
jgi:2-polyprenyl-3-methyl-5-hydroxy-6-metoxy-1,4-benzoquinol methylase